MTTRRSFITLLGSAAAAWPMAARAQQAGMPVVGFLRTDTPAAGASAASAFRKGLSEMGFVEGRNLTIEFRWAQNDRDRIPELAADLVRRNVDVIATPGSAIGALAVKALTTTIPIVFTTPFDPIKLGLVVSLSRPGANVTGLAYLGNEIAPKRLGLLYELLPHAARFGLLVSRDYLDVDRLAQDMRSAASAIERKVDMVFAGTDREIDEAFVDMVQKRIDAFMVPNDTVISSRQTQILTLAARHALPAIYTDRRWTEAGGLMSYGPLRDDQARQAGIYVGRILKGEKAADLPVVQATKFEFVINLATARAIGVQFPPTLLATADEVIE